MLFAACAVFMSGCGGGSGDGGGAPPVAVVKVAPATPNLNRIGERQALTATAEDADGNPIPGVAFLWSSSDPAVVNVDDTGLATAMGAGTAIVSAKAATPDNQESTSTLLVRTAVPSDVGDMYTVWPARSVEAPAVLVNGTLRVLSNMYVNAETPPPTPWSGPNVEKFQWEGDRIGVLSDMANGAGTFRVLDRRREWTVLAKGNAVDFQLEGNRIGVLRDDGSLRVKDGIDSPWTTLISAGVQRFQLWGDRIAVLLADGTLRAKDGINGTWSTLVTGGVRDFLLSGNRIGVLNTAGEFRVKDGINGTWTVLIGSGAEAFDLSADRIGVLNGAGGLIVKDGVNGTWTTLLAGGVQSFQLSGNRIGVLNTAGEFRVKDGINGPWTVLVGSGVVRFQLQEDRIGVLTDAGELLIKDGINGTWVGKTLAVDQVTQFRLTVDVPTAPTRTTPASYATSQQQCVADQQAGHRCFEAPAFAVPVNHYGRFCGANVPNDADLVWARNSGPMDSFDELCRHHDSGSIWYPDATAGGFDACIVRYGIVYGRLTRNGSLITAASPNWDAVWAEMPHLRSVIYDYDWYTSGCIDSKLAQFEATTASVR